MDYSVLFKKVALSIVNVIQLDTHNNIVSHSSGVIIGDGSKVLTCSHCVNPNYLNGIYDKGCKALKYGTILFNN